MRDMKGFKKSDTVANFYDIQGIIGRGSFGEVLRAVHLLTGDKRAIKVIHKDKIQKHEVLMQLQQQEFQVLLETDHPYLMKVHDLMEDEGHYYIISELLEGGELYDRIIKKKRFCEKDAAHVIHQVILALNYMHSKNIVHRDIKPENILLQSKELEILWIKITDFGFAKCYDPQEGGLKDTLGSPLYMAPEIVKKVMYDTKVDIWSLGVMTYIMLTGRPPFVGRTKEEIFIQIATQQVLYTDSIWIKLSKESKMFVKRCLTRDPRFRPSAAELLQHDWIKMNINKPNVSKEQLLDISNNLQLFRKYTVFQSGIIAYIMSFSQRWDDLDLLREIFMSIDKSNDGMITVDEIREALISVMGSIRGNMREFDEIMKDLDKDGNGVIDYSEFLVAAIDKHKLISFDNLSKAFTMIDTDSSGTITIDELKNAFEMNGKKDDKLWVQIMKEVDENQDGSISFDEFQEVMTSALNYHYKGLHSVCNVVKNQFKRKQTKSVIVFGNPQQGL